MAVLAAENVSYTYQSKYQKVQALKNVSCTFEAGKFYAIIGQSGSGKTTLLYMLAGLGTPSEGEIIANGKTLKELLDTYCTYHREVVIDSEIDN